MFALVTDAATKAWALSGLRDGHQIAVPGGILRFQLVANHGAAFGIGAGDESVVAIVSLALIIALAVWAARASTVAERLGGWLAVGGGLGNLLDRVVRPPGGLHGAVTDWIHVSFYGPTFNLADLWLRGGLLIAVIGWLCRAGGKDDDERTSVMQVGIHFMNFTLPGGPAGLRAAVGDTAVAAEEAGCTVFTAMDHWFQMEHFADAHDPMLEGYSVLNFVAAKTERLRLGLLVTGVTYRHPGLLAKTVTTLDVLSGGRAMLGIGAAWYEREHRALGVHYPPVAERFERLEETIQICEQMWSDDEGPYNGKYYQLAETICVPPPAAVAAPADPDRRRRREEDPAAGRAVRRRVQPVRPRVRRRSSASSTSCAGTATRSAATTTASRRRSSAGSIRRATSPSSCPRWSSTPPSASSLVEVAPSMPDPARFVTLLGDKVVRPLASIG